MSSLSTHVLDSATGKPAAGMAVALEAAALSAAADAARPGPAWRPVGRGLTDSDGRLTQWDGGLSGPGDYRLVFETAPWFAERDRECFYPEVVITFTVKDDSHYHVPLLLAPYAYSTYRGS
jgi:5-hydroxyisourate hydrolase